MANKDQIIKEKVENSGIFDFQGAYAFAHFWLIDSGGYKVSEKKYSEKVSGNTREINAEWNATKEVSDYFKIDLGIKIQAKEMIEVEVQIDGQKKKMNKGKISFEIQGDLIKDHENKWENNPFYRMMRDIYDEYIIPKKIEDMKKKIIFDVQTFKEEMKAFLELSAKK